MNRSLVSSMMDPGRRTLGVGYTMKHVEEELVSINSTSTTLFYTYPVFNISSTPVFKWFTIQVYAGTDKGDLEYQTAIQITIEILGNQDYF